MNWFFPPGMAGFLLAAEQLPAWGEYPILGAAFGALWWYARREAKGRDKAEERYEQLRTRTDDQIRTLGEAMNLVRISQAEPLKDLSGVLAELESFVKKRQQ